MSATFRLEVACASQSPFSKELGRGVGEISPYHFSLVVVIRPCKSTSSLQAHTPEKFQFESSRELTSPSNPMLLRRQHDDATELQLLTAHRRTRWSSSRDRGAPEDEATLVSWSQRVSPHKVATPKETGVQVMQPANWMVLGLASKSASLSSSFN